MYLYRKRERESLNISFLLEFKGKNTDMTEDISF